MSSNFTPLEDSGTPMVNLMTDPIRSPFKPRRHNPMKPRNDKFLAGFGFVKKKVTKNTAANLGFFKAHLRWALQQQTFQPTNSSQFFLWVTIRLTIFEAATFLVAFTILFTGPRILSSSHIVNISISL